MSKQQIILGVGAAAAVAGVLFLWRRRGGRKDVTAKLQYQTDDVPRSLLTTGKVYVERDKTGSDPPFVGTKFQSTPVRVRDGRNVPLTLDQHGVKFGKHTGIEGIDFYNEQDIIANYYPEMEKLVKEATGARRVIVFDHNVRKTLSHQPEGGDRIKGGNKVQVPLQLVHGDYTMKSAPDRVRTLSEKPKANDTLAKVLNGKSLVDPGEVDAILEGRYVFINVWRSFADTPILDQPLAVCDGSSVAPEDLVVFEVRYEDRTGENYFARHTAKHKWYYFPQMTKDECIFLKCWDSHGRDFSSLDGKTGAPKAPPPPGAVRSTFSLHSAFADPTTPAGAPPRESIEVRTVAFY
mmetsp:Transcript_27389/g.53404  ORF Transcript_27389/g.53404 Transcript_27389/m.53404 type:complete len:350 (-) Transcript_27389:76-1125(-)